MQVARALQERREIRIGERHFQRVENLAAALGEMVGEDLAGFGAGRPVGQDRDRFLAAVLDRPVGDDAGLLAERETRAHVIGRAFGDDGCARHHHHGRHLGFGRNRRHRHGARRQAGAEEIDLVVDDQFLGQPLGIVGNAAVVPDDQLDLLAGDGVAVLRHVELGAVRDLAADGALHAGHRNDDPDLDGLGGLRCGVPSGQAQADHAQTGSGHRQAHSNSTRHAHDVLPLIGSF